MNGPTSKKICNDYKNPCSHLDDWYNGGSFAFGRCKKGAWDGIKQWDAGGACDTPQKCPFKGDLE